MEVVLEPFPFEEKWGPFKTLHLTGVQLILVEAKPKTSPVCSPEGWQSWKGFPVLKLSGKIQSFRHIQIYWAFWTPCLAVVCFVVLDTEQWLGETISSGEQTAPFLNSRWSVSVLKALWLMWVARTESWLLKADPWASGPITAGDPSQRSTCRYQV